MTIKSLDGLRGFAVVLVLLSHMSLEGINLAPFLDFSGVGKAGVYLFFTLSAFLLTWQAMGEGRETLLYPRYWGGYLLRRFFRIYPLYLITILVSLLVTQFAPGYSPRIDDVTELLRHLVLLEGESIYWAIPVEFKYYALLPVTTIALYWLNKLSPFAPVAVTSFFIVLIHLVWPPSETGTNSIQIGPYLGIFLLGSLIAVLYSGTTDSLLSRYPKCLAVMGWLSISVGLLTVPSIWRLLVAPEATNQAFHKDFLFYGLLWCASVTAAMKGSRLFTAFFELEACRFVGRISFSVYLWHYLIVQLVSRDVEIHSTLQFLLVLTVTFPLSWASYRIIERPFVSWGHRTTSNWNKSMTNP